MRCPKCGGDNFDSNDHCLNCGYTPPTPKPPPWWNTDRPQSSGKDNPAEYNDIGKPPPTSPEKPLAEPFSALQICPRCRRKSLYWNRSTRLYECFNQRCKARITEKELGYSIQFYLQGSRREREVISPKEISNSNITTEPNDFANHQPPTRKKWNIEDNPRNNLGCGFVLLILAFIPLVIGWAVFRDSGDYFAVAGTVAGFLGIVGVLIILANASVLAVGERSAATIGKIAFGFLCLFCGAATPFIWPGSFWVMRIPFIPLPYSGNIFLVIMGIGLLYWAIRE